VNQELNFRNILKFNEAGVDVVAVASAGKYSLQIDNHTITPSLNFSNGQMLFLPHNQQSQSTEETMYRKCSRNIDFYRSSSQRMRKCSGNI